MRPSSNPRSLQYSISFVPEWEDIDSVRTSVIAGLHAVWHDEALQGAVAMAASELLENAIKHGESAAAEVTLTLEVLPQEAVLSVGNACGQSRGTGRRLDEMLRWINRFADPQEAYVKRMQELLEAETPAEGGLGLVRVAYEGGAKLRLVPVSDPRRVEVEARFARAERPTPAVAVAPAEEESQEPAKVTIQEGPPVTVLFVGTLAERAPEEWLMSLLLEAQQKVEQQDGFQLILDIRELKHMSASAFRVVISFLRQLKALTGPWKLRVLANSRHGWQQVATSSLRVIGGSSVVVEDGQG